VKKYEIKTLATLISEEKYQSKLIEQSVVFKMMG
jgi:hypothetical protein